MVADRTAPAGRTHAKPEFEWLPKPERGRTELFEGSVGRSVEMSNPNIALPRLKEKKKGCILIDVKMSKISQ